MPLTAAAAPGENREFRVSIMPSGGQPASAFESLRSAAPASGGPVPEGAKKCEPQVILQREGDRITGIRVQCVCGHVMDLACGYEPEARSA